VSVQRDPDLDRIGDEQRWDPHLREFAQYLRATPHPYAHVEPTPHFRQALQRQVMRRAWEQASRPVPPWYRRLLAPQPMAWAAAAVGAVLIVFVAFFFAASPRQTDLINVSVTSPQQNAQAVPIVQPIELDFHQAMDNSSVQVQIQPPTTVRSQWQGNTLTITPVNGLSSNTQYVVTVTSARTAQQQPVGKIQPVTFVTGPTTPPTPIAGPTPTPQPLPIQNQRAIAAIGGLPAVWSADGSGLYVVGPDGALELYQVQGGPAQKIADGVTAFAVAADGTVARIAGGQLTWKSPIATPAQPIALGFRQTALVLATAADVETTGQQRLAVFKETATAAEFSRGGDRLAYLGASGLHLVDLGSGSDTLIGPAHGLGDWSPDGHRYAYATDSGVAIVDAATGSSTKLVDLAGVTGVTWSQLNQLLLSTASTLYLASYTGGSQVTAHKLQDGVFGQPDWAPGTAGLFSFLRGGHVWVARLQASLLQGGPSGAPGMSQGDLVSAFMAARQSQLTDQATSFLDAAARDDFSRLTLIYSDPSTALARYYVLLSQPGRVVVRMVLGRGPVQTAIDETLVIQLDASGRPLIHGATEAPRSPFASGPEVVSVVVTSTQVQVQFDSDLDAGSAVQSAAVSIRGVTTAVQFDSRQRTVTLTVPGGFTAGTTYDLHVGSALQDVGQRHAVPYELQFAGPAGS